MRCSSRRANETYVAKRNKCSELHFKKLSHQEDETIYIICNLKKLKKDAITDVEEENERDENYSATNPQIDNSRTKDNYHIVDPSGKYMDVIEQRIAGLHLKRKVRSDAVYIVSFVLGASPEFFKVSTKEKQYALFRDCAKFFQDKYGEENVLSAIVHMDETNPHMHLNLIPITNGKLCAKDLFDGKLAALQTEFWEAVGEKYGLDRGEPNSQAEHLDTAEYKAKKIVEAAEQKRIEAEEYSEALPNYQSKSGTAFTYEEEKKLVNHCLANLKKDTSHAFLVLLYAGLRRSELASLNVIDGVWLECETSKERMGKNVVKRKIPITPMMKKVLPYIDFEKAKHVNLSTLQTTMKRLFPNHHSHELRHTFISRSKESGVLSEVVSIWAGHSLSGTITTTVYTHYSEEFQLREAEKVDYLKWDFNT